MTYNFYFIYSKDSNIIVFFSSLIASFWSRNVNSIPATDVAPPLTVFLSPCVILSLFPGGHYQQNLDFMKVPFWSFVLSLINESDSLHKLKIEKRILMYFWQRNKNEKKKNRWPTGSHGSTYKIEHCSPLKFQTQNYWFIYTNSIKRRKRKWWEISKSCFYFPYILKCIPKQLGKEEIKTEEREERDLQMKQEKCHLHSHCLANTSVQNKTICLFTKYLK